MFGALKRLGLGRRDAVVDPGGFVPALPEGKRIYAIGDIHGRLDLLNTLLALIDRDDGARGDAETILILLGDLIDRGGQSAGVVERVLHLKTARDRVHVIKGNHEEVMLSALAGDDAAMRLFLRIGGAQTLESYGVSMEGLPPGDELDVLMQRMQAAMPRAHHAFLSAMEDSVAIGDYLFVHAGIRPGVAIADQDPAEQRWIRNAFLDHQGHHGMMIVHGHSITDAPVLRPNRLGIDTGAYHSGVLTALGLEGADRWIIQTEPTGEEVPGGPGED